MVINRQAPLSLHGSIIIRFRTFFFLCFLSSFYTHWKRFLLPSLFLVRFMASVWALFAVVFLAIYTANLAAFMITREEWDQFSGLDDAKVNKRWRFCCREILCKIPWIFQLSNPQSMKPPLKFGTVPWTYSDNALRKHFPNMHLHMKQYNEQNVVDGVNAVKRGWARMINMSFISCSKYYKRATNGKICKILREYDDVELNFCIKLQKSISDTLMICKIN